MSRLINYICFLFCSCGVGIDFSDGVADDDGIRALHVVGTINGALEEFEGSMLSAQTPGSCLRIYQCEAQNLKLTTSYSNCQDKSGSVFTAVAALKFPSFSSCSAHRSGVDASVGELLRLTRDLWTGSWLDQELQIEGPTDATYQVNAAYRELSVPLVSRSQSNLVYKVYSSLSSPPRFKGRRADADRLWDTGMMSLDQGSSIASTWSPALLKWASDSCCHPTSGQMTGSIIEDGEERSVSLSPQETCGSYVFTDHTGASKSFTLESCF